MSLADDVDTAPSLPERAPRRGIKRVLPRTFFARALLIIVTPVVLAQALATWIFFDRHLDSMSRRLASNIAGDIAMIVDNLDRDPTDNGIQRTLATAARTTDLIVTLEKGKTLPGNPPPPRSGLQRTLANAINERVNRPFTINTELVQDWYEIRVAVPGGVISVMSPEKRLFNPTTIVFLLWMMGSASVLLAVAIVFMRNQIRPIRRLAIAAEAFGKGRDIPSFKPEGALEVRKAAAAFILMRDRLKRQIAQRTAMLAGVSHDLRTPLTRMKLALDMLPEGLEADELKDDVTEMETMIEGYLAFVRGEGGEAVQPTDLNRLLSEVVNGARREGATVELSMADGLMLPLRPNAVRRCFANLLANARRHAKTIRVDARVHGDSIEVTVDDDGPGIPANRREDVFRPFFRIDSSRNQSTGGAGLGLTIARDVVRSHGGDIELSDSPAGGLRARTRLPL
jgi:two-component system, OmpR family, osmolarity sensor histidine kinase EnvZ